jgi:hypothetical protein
MFKAEDAVPKLEWDFTHWVPGAKGISPEPSNMALLAFNAEMRALVDAETRIKKAQIVLAMEKAGGLSDEEKKAELDRWASLDLAEGTAEALEEVLAILPPEEGEKLNQKQAALVAGLLNDCPSVDQIMGLPGRVRQAYFGWIAGQLMDPEFGAVGSKS